MKPTAAATALGLFIASSSLLASDAFAPKPLHLSAARRPVVVGAGPNHKTQLFAADINEKTDAVTNDEPTTTTTNANEYAIQEQRGEKADADSLMQKIKDAGTAGVISYMLWELGFWGLSVPVVVGGYHQVTGHWPDLSNQEDLGKLGAEAFAFVNVARFAVPLRIGLALGTTPWIQENIVDRFFHQEG